MTAIPIVVVAESDQFHLEIRCRPKQQAIQTLLADGSDQSLNERMGPGNVWNRFNFRNVQNSKVGLPLDETIQRIVIGTQVFGHLEQRNWVNRTSRSASDLERQRHKHEFVATFFRACLR